MILQQMDYLAFLDIYHERVKAFHVKDGEFRASGRSGVYGGYQDWIDRPGRFRSLGDGQIDFHSILSKMASTTIRAGRCGVGMLLKHPKRRGRRAVFTRNHIIRVTDRAFDDFAGGSADGERNRRILGLGRHEVSSH